MGSLLFEIGHVTGLSGVAIVSFLAPELVELVVPQASRIDPASGTASAAIADRLSMSRRESGAPLKRSGIGSRSAIAHSDQSGPRPTTHRLGSIVVAS